jgi:hypothetical protein
MNEVFEHDYKGQELLIGLDPFKEDGKTINKVCISLGDRYEGFSHYLNKEEAEGLLMFLQSAIKEM